MSQQDLLKRVVATLDQAGIEYMYMISGSIASTLQGEPRLTHDIDVVVAISSSTVPVVLAAFPAPQFYVSEHAVSEAIRTSGMFDVIEASEGDKVDLWLLTDDPFDRSRFARRYEEEAFGMRIRVSSPEDTILAKLRRRAST